MRIGVFDSGIGGITVLSELKRRMPEATYIYLGDTAHVPYGTKSPAQIERLSSDCALMLQAKKIDALVVACNTASSLALDAIRKVMGPVPVLGVVEPGVTAALSALNKAILSLRLSREAPVLVLATRATVQSRAYGINLRKVLKTSVIEQACPLLVPMIEEGWTDHPILHQTIAEYVTTHVKNQKPGIALLGCTHYPWIQQAFEKALPGWTVVNSAQAVANALESDFNSGKLGPKPNNGQRSKKSEKTEVEWIFTDPQAVPGFARKLIEDESGVIDV